jgi:hypothetical protein
MGKKARIKRERLQKMAAALPPLWKDAEGIHAMLPFPAAPPPGTADLLTANFQRQIRRSPMWQQLVDRFGEKKAEELLKECKAEIR